MRLVRVYVVLSVVLTIPVFAQQTATPTSQSSPQAVTLLQKSLAVLMANNTISDVTLSGSARRVAGSDDETGTATLKALASGAGRADLSLPSGSRIELANIAATPPTGAWSGPDGASHAMAYHNLLSEPAWFFPAFAIAHRLSTTGYIATYIGHETHEGQPVEHVAVSQTPSAQTPSFAPIFMHLTQLDFYLDSTTLLPAAIAFNIHPDNDALLDIPVEIRFSDYRTVGGSRVPYRIQKFLNNGLALDFQAQSITFNTGLSATTFAVEAGL